MLWAENRNRSGTSNAARLALTGLAFLVAALCGAAMERGKLVATLCSVCHCNMPTSSLAMRLFLLTLTRGAKTSQHEKDAFCQ